VNHNTDAVEADKMITLRKRLARSAKARTLLPAVAFFFLASLSAVGGGTIAALCLLPAGLALEAGRSHHDPDESQA